MGKTDLLENLMQVAPLKLIVHKSAEALGEEVNAALVEARKKINKPYSSSPASLDWRTSTSPT